LLLRLAAKAVLGIVLLGQIALAAQACLMPGYRPAAAFAADQAMPGCEHDRAPVDVICLAQCLQPDQAVDPAHPLAGDLPPPAWERVPLAGLAPSEAARDAATLPAGPPLYLRSRRLRL
jgi:hypothetical protein